MTSSTDTSAKRSKYVIPHGFQELLTSLSREVLRAQPTDIIQFSTLYFLTLQDFIEKKKQFNSSYSGSLLINSVEDYSEFKKVLFTEASSALSIAAFQRGLIGETSTIRPSLLNLAQTNSAQNQVHAHKKETTPISPEEEHAATKIQAGIRGYLTRKEVQKKKDEETKAAMKIQATYRGFSTRRQMGKTSPRSPTKQHNDSRPVTGQQSSSSPTNHGGAAPTLGNANDTQPASPSTRDEDAAVRIQSAYRGFHQRKKFHQEREAATKIQAGFRGFKVRRGNKERGSTPTTPDAVPGSPPGQ